MSGTGHRAQRGVEGQLAGQPDYHDRPFEREFVAGKDVPGFDPGFVQRPRLIETLLRSPSARLVLLTAPAGYSKTTCLTEWAMADDRPFAWVSASARHDDPALLVASIVEALDQIESIDASVLRALASPKPSISTVVLPRLGKALRTRMVPFVLVIDDVHELTSPEAFEVLEAVIGLLPAGSQLALASRSEPLLALGRMRAHRELVELTEHDLAMVRAESAELLANLGLELGPDQVEVIADRTEGWPAALYLAGLALVDQADTAAAVSGFAGDDRIVVDYLRDEFLSATDPARLSFLTRSAVLDELSGPLCDVVLERSGSAQMLRELARSNYLVIPLDRTDGRYRYHHLFEEMLRSELHRREPELEPQLHARASHWYADHSDPDRAIDHAIAAGELGWAGELIWLAFPEVTGRGRIATLERWLDQVGDERAATSQTLALASAHRDVVLGRGDRAAHWARIAAGIAETSNGGTDAILADVHLLNATLATEGVVQMGKEAARASELHPPDSPWQSPCYLYRGVSSQLTGHPQRARPLLQEAARRGAVVSPIVQSLALAQLCLIAIDDGDWEAGSRLIAQARGQVDRSGLSDLPAIAAVHAVSTLVHAHEGRVERAQADLVSTSQLLGVLSDFPPWYEAEASIVLSRASYRLDDVTRARVLLDEASSFLERTPDAVILTNWVDETARTLASAHGREALTKAELRTLQYLPSHLSFREIGERIHVSPNTVKTQAQAIYRKLDASSRAEAVELALSAGLIGEGRSRSSEPGDVAPSETT